MAAGSTRSQAIHNMAILKRIAHDLLREDQFPELI